MQHHCEASARAAEALSAPERPAVEVVEGDDGSGVVIIRDPVLLRRLGAVARRRRQSIAETARQFLANAC